MKRFNWVYGVCVLVLLFSAGCNDSSSVFDDGSGESTFDQETVDAITAELLVPTIQAVNLNFINSPIPLAASTGDGGTPGTSCQDSSELCSSGTAEVCTIGSTEIDFTFTDCASEDGGITNGSIVFSFGGPNNVIFDISYNDLTFQGSMLLEEEGLCLRHTLDQLVVVSSQFSTTVDASLLYCGSQWPESGTFDQSITGTDLDYRFNVVFDGSSQAEAVISDLSSGTELAVCSIDLYAAQAVCQVSEA